MFRWGVLSTAKIARQQVLPGIYDSENGVATAIASLNPGRAEQAAGQFAIPHVFNSYDDLLASDTVDGVYIPIQTAGHTEWTLKAITAGKHVLCEKPITMTAEDIPRLIEARDKSGLTVSEAFMVYYHPQWAKVRALVAGGAIGRLRHVQGAFTYRNMDPDSTRNRVDAGGGALPDIGVYPTVTTRMVTDLEPVRVQAKVERDPAFGTDAFSSVRADFGGFELTFYTSTQMALRQFMLFHGDTGFIEVHAPFNAGDYEHAFITLQGEKHEDAQIFRFPVPKQYKLEVEAFVRTVRGEESPLFTLENSLGNQKMIDAVFRAGGTDDWVIV